MWPSLRLDGAGALLSCQQPPQEPLAQRPPCILEAAPEARARPAAEAAAPVNHLQDRVPPAFTRMLAPLPCALWGRLTAGHPGAGGEEGPGLRLHTCVSVSSSEEWDGDGTEQ